MPSLHGSHRLQKLTKSPGEPGVTQRKTFDLLRSYAGGSLTIFAARFE